MKIDLLEEESDDDNDNDDLVQPGQENIAVEPLSLESSNDKDEEAYSEGQSVPLIESRLGGVSVDEEENEEFVRAKLQATPRKLFVSMSQPSSSDPRRESQSSFSLLLPPLNPSNIQRSKRIPESEDMHKQRAMDDPNMRMLVASQASVSESPNLAVDVNMIMLSMLRKMQESQETSNKRNLDMLEQHRLDMEM